MVPALEKNHADNRHIMRDFGALFDALSATCKDISKSAAKTDVSVKEPFFGYVSVMSVDPALSVAMKKRALQRLERGLHGGYCMERHGL